MMNNGERWRWSVYGTLALVVLSVSVRMTDEMAYPWPLPQLILHWIVPYSFIFVLPLVYGITSWILWPRPSFGPVVLWTVLVVGVLNLVYFLSFLVDWDLVEYKGAAVLGLNATIIGISASLVLVALGVSKRRRRLNSAAYLLLFSLLSRCAFPVMGSTDI